MEQINSSNISNNGIQYINFDFDYTFRTISHHNLLKLSINLFFGINFIHNHQISLNGKFQLNNIFVQVLICLFFPIFYIKNNLFFSFKLKKKNGFFFNVKNFFILNDANCLKDIYQLGFLLRKILQIRKY